MFYFLFRILAYGKSTILLVYLAFFYPFRFLSLYGGHWPLPDYQTFHYPGIPSILVPYDQTNDFYFSGHTGLCTILMFMFILHFNDKENYRIQPITEDLSLSVTTTSSQNELLPENNSSDRQNIYSKSFWHKMSISYGFFVLLLTLYMLTITRGHYFNDLLIGFLVSLIGIYYGTKLRYTVSYGLIWGYSKLFSTIICSNYNSNKNSKNLKDKLVSEDIEPNTKKKSV